MAFKRYVETVYDNKICIQHIKMRKNYESKVCIKNYNNDEVWK